MRWAIFAGIALLSLVVIATAVVRVIQVVNVFAPASATEPQFVASAAPDGDDPVTRNPSGPPVIVGPAVEEVSGKTATGTLPALSRELDEALRTAGTRAPRKQQVPPQTAPHKNPRPVIAEMKLDSAGLGGEVEGLAQNVAPALAREVAEHATDNAALNADVAHELLQTLQEQRQILSGQRETIDSVLKENTR